MSIRSPFCITLLVAENKTHTHSYDLPRHIPIDKHTHACTYRHVYFKIIFRGKRNMEFLNFANKQCCWYQKENSTKYHTTFTFKRKTNTELYQETLNMYFLMWEYATLVNKSCRRHDSEVSWILESFMHLSGSTYLQWDNASFLFSIKISATPLYAALCYPCWKKRPTLYITQWIHLDRFQLHCLKYHTVHYAKTSILNVTWLLIWNSENLISQCEHHR